MSNHLYVLDDAVIVAVLKQYDGKLSAGDPLDTLLNSITGQMEPLPKGLGAVVEMTDGRMAVRCDAGQSTGNLHWRIEGSGGEWLDDAEMLRPFKVLSRGVES